MKLAKIFPWKLNRQSFRSIAVGVLCLACVTAIFLAETPEVFARNLLEPSPVLAASLFHFSGSPPKDLGVKDGKLKSCPASPNCVCSYDTDAEHQIAPLAYTGNAKEAFDRLKSIVGSIENAAIVQSTPNYLYAEFTSKLMGFVDDVEFYLDEAAGTIQVRSASRLGQSDLGVNRQRIETIRSKFNA